MSASQVRAEVFSFCYYDSMKVIEMSFRQCLTGMINGASRIPYQTHIYARYNATIAI